jgi:hypothetical protein
MNQNKTEQFIRETLRREGFSEFGRNMVINYAEMFGEVEKVVLDETLWASVTRMSIANIPTLKEILDMMPSLISQNLKESDDETEEGGDEI